MHWVFIALRTFLKLRRAGASPVAVCGLLVAVVSLVAEHSLWEPRASAVVACGLSSCISWALDLRLNSCGTRVELLCGVWDLPGPGIEPMSLALAGGFFTTEPPWRP